MTPTISTTDYNILRKLISYVTPAYGTKEISQLQNELSKAKVIPDKKVNRKTVRLNSEVEIKDEQTGKITRLTIVLPDHADLKERKISILAPLSIALIGFNEGDEFQWQLPGGLKTIRIVNVKNS